VALLEIYGESYWGDTTNANTGAPSEVVDGALLTADDTAVVAGIRARIVF
jgi:hypothetical protein